MSGGDGISTVASMLPSAAHSTRCCGLDPSLAGRNSLNTMHETQITLVDAMRRLWLDVPSLRTQPPWQYEIDVLDYVENRKEGRGCRPKKEAGVANLHGLRLDPGGNAASALATDSREAEQRLLLCQDFRARVLGGLAL